MVPKATSSLALLDDKNMLHLLSSRALDQNRRNEQRVDPNQKKNKKIANSRSIDCHSFLHAQAQ